MKRNLTHRPVALAALIAATAIPFNPALSQDAAAPVVAPPVVQAPPPAPTAPVASQAPVFRPSQEVVQPTPPRAIPVPEVAAEPAATVAPRASAPRRAAPRPVATATRAAAPVTAATNAAPAPVSNPVAETAAPVPPVAELPEPAPVPVTTPPSAPVEPTSGLPLGWLIGGLGAALIALLAFMFVRRRRSEDYGYGTADYVAVDEAGAPVPDVDLDERPWIRLAIQPTATESRGGEQVVDYKLIVENEGNVPAHDVKVSSFLTGLMTSAVDSLGNGQAQTRNIDVEAGSSVTLAGKITVRDGVDPKIVADARYPLPDGSEGHLAARFGIDMSADEPTAEVEDVLERV